MRRCILTLFALALCAAPARAITTVALLDSVQHASFRYVWYQANPANGMVRDRSQPGSPASIAAVGFALSAITVAIDHGWITREAGRDRVLTTLNTLWTKPQGPFSTGYIGYKGFFYHFLDMTTALRTWSSELSTIDTALLFGGMLHCREYFSSTDPVEGQIRALADSIYLRADWKFMQNNQPSITHGWKPVGEAGGGFIPYRWIGYSEGMIIYILALGSPTFPATAVTVSPWAAWTAGYSYQTQYGLTYVNFPPLFGHQFSHCWIDFRYIQDSYMRTRGLTYFENSRRATLAQRRYSIRNPLGRVGYSDSLWGITPSDDPEGYSARGAPPPQDDDGTIAPTAALSSIPFTPDSSFAVMHKLWNTYKDQLWGPYGFRDAFNLTSNPDWFATDYLGIDQGPIVLMIENHLNSSIWHRFMQNPYVQAGLASAGFTRASSGLEEGTLADAQTLLSNTPNPFRDATTVQFRLPAAGPVRLAVYDVRGREVARLVDGQRAAGLHQVTLEGRGLDAGVYYYRLEHAGGTSMRRCVLLR